MADLALVGAVRVHDPNLPVAGAIGYEIDFGAEQRCAAHLRYNIGREFVGRFLSSGLVRRAEVTLAEDLGLRNRGLPHVEQPAVEHQSESHAPPPLRGCWPGRVGWGAGCSRKSEGCCGTCSGYMVLGTILKMPDASRSL